MTEQGIAQFRLPDVGEGLTEAEILQWRVRPGERVEVNQIIVEIETAKAAVELPSPYEGTVRELHVTEGQTVEVGTPIITVDTGGGAAPAPAQAEEPATATERPAEPAPERASGGEPEPAAPASGTETKREPVLVGYGVKEGATRRRPRGRRPGGHPGGPAGGTATPPPPAPGAGHPANGSGGPGGVEALAKPPVRKLAKDLGVDLRAVRPTGPGGVVTRSDVQRHHDGGAAPSTPATAGAAEREERVPIRGVRKHTAAAMVRSAFTAPHVTEFLQVDVTETMAAVRRLRERPEFDGLKVSPLLLVARALLVAARRHPGINATWDEEAQEIVVKRYVNLGIAVAAERGLVVPNIKEAQDRSLPDLAAELRRLTETARQGRTTPADLSGGTITITNIGVFGIDAGTPILNPGEAAILAFGQVRDMPWVHQGELAVRKVTTLALSFDHRLVDGELGSKALRDVGSMLEDPLAALAWG